MWPAGTARSCSRKRLDALVPKGHDDWVIIDEVQKIPALLDEVHRLIESRRLKFILTGSSARKLRRKGVNLLAGRALTLHLHPLTARELGADFDLDFSGLKAFLEDYPMAKVYLIYGGERRMSEGAIDVISMAECLRSLPQLLA